jgi:hypothetical protein
MDLPFDGGISHYLKTEEPKAAHRASLMPA